MIPLVAPSSSSRSSPSIVLEALVEQVALERIEENLFRGQSQDLGWGTVFGGQVLGEALSAAVQTIHARGMCMRCTRTSCVPAT